jgi:type II secretory pathway pseudopilin PulG
MLQVTWAQLSTLPRRSPGGPPPPIPKGFTVSYACLPTFVTPSEVAALFERFGMVLQVVPFAHRREGPANSRGCGLVVVKSETAATDSIEALSGKFTWPGAERPLLVQPFYGVERAGPHQLPTLPEGPSNSSSNMQGGSSGQGGSSSGGRMWQPPSNSGRQQQGGRRGGYGGYGGGPMHDREQQQQQQRGGMAAAQAPAGAGDDEPAPPGCSADAFKLVLSNVPSSYSQADVSALLQPYGHVVSAFREQGRDSSGDTVSVWYANGGQAEGAVAGLRNVVLMAPDGPRRLLLTACYSGPVSRHQKQRQEQQQQHSMHPGSNSPYASGGHLSSGGSGGIMDAACRGSAAATLMQQQLAYQQQQQAQQAQAQAQMAQQQFNMQQLQQQQGVQMLAQGQGPPGVMQVWNTQAPPSTAPVSAAAAITMQLAGAHLSQAAQASSGGFDMQQLAYALPQQQGGVGVSAPMVQQAGQMWPNPGGSPQMLVGGMGQSGSMLEQLGQLGSDASSVAGAYMGSNPAAPSVTTGLPAGMGYTGWLY